MKKIFTLVAALSTLTLGAQTIQQVRNMSIGATVTVKGVV
jgi:hypothetical protein